VHFQLLRYFYRYFYREFGLLYFIHFYREFGLLYLYLIVMPPGWPEVVALFHCRASRMTGSRGSVPSFVPPLFDCHASRMAGSRGSVSLSCLPDDRKSWLCSIVRATFI
jgi:hypothetical protein